MDKILKWAGMAALLFFLAAFISSCSSSRHLGCPMKITSSGAQVQSPAA